MLAYDSDNILAYKASRQFSHGPFGYSLTVELDEDGLLQSDTYLSFNQCMTKLVSCIFIPVSVQSIVWENDVYYQGF